MDKLSIRPQATSFLYLIVLIAVACGPSNGHTVQSNPSYLSSYLESGYYTINPQTILASLDRGKTDVFTPLLATQDPNTPLLPSGSAFWTQSDYLKIAETLSQNVWQDTLQGWNVYYLAFDKQCQDNPVGFDSLDITYYKIIEVSERKVYTARHIEIYPLAGVVSWGGGTTFSISDKWYGIDLTMFKITADDALQRAEENGGEAARLKVRNDCRILIRTPNHDDDDSWDVSYYFGVNFEILVDPYTGSYVFPTPSP
jgi:hypothetical protein